MSIAGTLFGRGKPKQIVSRSGLRASMQSPQTTVEIAMAPDGHTAIKATRRGHLVYFVELPAEDTPMSLALEAEAAHVAAVNRRNNRPEGTP